MASNRKIPQHFRESLEATELRHRKPLLTVDQQITRLKAKGITFDLLSEEEAADLLANGNNYLRITSYCKLYERKTEGPEARSYINLDFGHLAVLSSLDRQLRDAFLAVTVDVEHFAKMKVLAGVENHGEDGYGIVADFYASLNHAGRNAIQGAMHARSRTGERHDIYTGELIAHHIEDMPVWVLQEVIDFGTFVDFYLFCAARWEDDVMLQEHYVLKSVKALRNATAHNHCIANGFTQAAEAASYSTNSLIIESLNRHGLPRTKSRRSKLSNLRIAQMAAALYSLNALCRREPAMRKNAERLNALRKNYEAALPQLSKNSTVVSFFDFLFKLVDIWVPMPS
ncbi:Abi family protein [Adlercreutzia sp. ZJ305]|nr:Abi family protein [Adlercreutzia sp. ZJ305]